MSQRLQHTIDSATSWRTGTPAPPRQAVASGLRVGRPGVIGAELIRAAPVRNRVLVVDGPPPVDPGELAFLAVDTRAPYTRDYAGAQGGKPAHYMLRWVNSRGETGPWSETATATIGA